MKLTLGNTMDDLQHIIPFFIPIIAIVMGIGIGMMSIWLDYQKRVRLFELNHKERLFALERGIELPPLPADFFNRGNSMEEPLARRMNSLRWGLLWLLLGIALAFAMLINNGFEGATWALLPIAVGVAQLIYYKIAASHFNALSGASAPEPGTELK
jgi:hypothetical protein